MDAKTLNKLRFHLDRLVLGTSAVPEEDWQKLDALVPAALRAPPTAESVALRHMLEELARRIADRRLVDNVYALTQELERVAQAGATSRRRRRDRVRRPRRSRTSYAVARYS